MKRISAFLILLFFVVSLAGCQTAKGAATGVGLTAQGAGQDTCSLWGALVKLDNWMKKNMW
jgi:predicted small secreted protein